MTTLVMPVLSNKQTTQSLTAKSARKLLGEIAQDMNDNEIESLIHQLELLANTVIEALLVQKHNS